MKFSKLELRKRSMVLIAMTALAGISSFALVSATQGPDERPVGGAKTAPEYIASVSGLIPPEQRSALSDGIVTYEEHEAAIQRTIACAAAAGVRMEVTPGAGLRTTQLGFVSSTWEENRESQKKLDACVEQYLKYVETARASQPVDTAVIADAAARLVECMKAAAAVGFDAATVRAEIDTLVTKQGRSKADYDSLKAWDTCHGQVEETVGFRP